MLVDVLKSSYLQYKSDTNAVATWLANTAKSCGYSVDLLVDKAEGDGRQQQSGRLKGKARKAAREAARNEGIENAVPAPKVPTYTLAIKDFVSLADLIASYTKRPIKVPLGFVGAINRAISVRRKHREQVGGKDEKSDERHSFFIGILEHVHNVLRPRMPPEYVGGTEPSTRSADASTNKFEGLEVEEPSEQFLRAPDISQANSKPADRAKYEVRQEDSEDAYLVFSLILEDYNKFRTLIHKTWAGFKEGVFDLVSASIMTNTAIDLARRLEEDATPLFDKCEGSERMLQKFWLATCITYGQDETAKEHPDDDMNFSMYKVSETFFWPTHMLLEAFLRVIEPGSMPIMKPGYFGIYEPTSDRSKMTDREKFKEDKAMLCGILPDFYLACCSTPVFYSEDEFMKGLRSAFKTKNVPLWLVFATQVYLDVHHILRDGVSEWYAYLFELDRVFTNSIEANFEFHNSLRIDNWPRSNDMVIRQLLKHMDGIVMQDQILQKKRNLGLPSYLHGKPFDLMRSHPILCGLCACDFKIKYQELGIMFVNAWGSVLYTYQLYNGVRQEKLMQNKWQDMDIIMRMQDEVFGRERPAKFEDYVKVFSLSIGVSATAFAKNKRKGPLPVSKDGPRGMLKELAPVALTFKDRFCSTSGQTDLSLQDLERIVAKSVWKIDEVGEALSDMGFPSLARESKKGKAANAKQAISQRRPNATELLESLRNSLMGERLELDFDYLTLHRICWRLLRLIQKECDPKLTKMCGAGYLEQENQLPFVVGYIFGAAAKTKLLGSMLAKKSDIVTSELLVQAASVMNAYVQQHGKTVSSIMEVVHRVAVGFESDSEEDVKS